MFSGKAAELNKKMLQKPFAVWLWGAVYILIPFATFAAYRLFHQNNLFKLLWVIMIELIIITNLALYKKAKKRPEIFFFIIVMICGFFLIRMTPLTVGTMWDDEVHYANTLHLANGITGKTSVADIQMLDEYSEHMKVHYGYDRNSRAEYAKELNDLYASENYVNKNVGSIGLYSVSYIPGTVGIWLGRLLHLKYTEIFMMGKFFNLLAYALLMCIAIRRIPYAKVLLACIGMLPTNIFMACSYSYDPWLIGFTAIGFSYLFAILAEDGKMKMRDFGIMIGAMVLGCLVKAVYFPMLFPMLFIPKEKFESKKQHRIAVIIVFAAAIALVLSFLLPMMISSGDTYSDARGGDGVNAMGQIMYILSNPLTFAGIMTDYLTNLLRMENWPIALSSWAYVGNGKYYVFITVIMIAVAFMYKKNKKTCTVPIRITGIIGIFGALLLSCAAMYISFTEVGLNTINGFQFRYLIPYFFPFLYLIGGDGGQTEYPSSYVTLPITMIALCIWGNISYLIVVIY